MKLSQLAQRKWNYTALAFVFPFAGMLILMMIGGYSPFGKYSMLYSDMYHQYFPFFVSYRKALLSGESLLYNWSVGLGLDYLGLMAYYLSSPLNLLSILVPERWLLGYFSLLVPIKMGLASMFFSIFLKKIFKKDDLSISLFGSLYGMCAWALGYQWNVMWLDTFALLPLVVLGMLSLMRQKKFVLYTITLFLSIFANYYIGFFTCIFIFLLFFCYQICRWQGFAKFFGDLCRIALFSLLAIGMTAILELPALAALQNTQSGINTFPTGFYLNIADSNTWKGLFEAMKKVAGNMNGGLTPTFKEGLPNIYCGVLTTILATIYLFCKQVKLRDKICCVFLLLFFNVSFIFRQLDYIWHGFHFTNMIPYRFSFLYSFVMLYMAYTAWTHRKTFRLWQVILGCLAAVGILFCSENLSDTVFWAYNGVLIVLYLSVLVYHTLFRPAPPSADRQQRLAYRHARDARKQLCSLALMGAIGVELVLNLVNFGVSFPATDVSNYPRGTADSKAVFRYMHKREYNNLFYRAEVTHNQTLNDGALNSYNGITTFTSSANVKVTEFMKALGFAAKNTYNRYSFEESSPVANLFLGLKYMIERDGQVEDNPYFEDIYWSNNVHLLENKAYLPLGFLANSQLLNVSFAEKGDRFEFQNLLMQQATGIQKDVWHILPGSALNIITDGPEATKRPYVGFCAYETTDSAGTITFSYTADREGLMCAYLDLSLRNNFTFFLNGEMLYSESHSLPQMLSICNVKPGDIVDIQMTCQRNENGKISVSAAILDDAVFLQGYEQLSKSVLELNSFSNTKIAGTINCQQDGVLYTSIPQNGNWHAYVDEQPVETVLIGDAMLGVPLTEGSHTIRFVYKNAAFSLGWKITALCTLMFTGIYLLAYRPSFQRKRGKYERQTPRKREHQ